VVAQKLGLIRTRTSVLDTTFVAVVKIVPVRPSVTVVVVVNRSEANTDTVLVTVIV